MFFLSNHLLPIPYAKLLLITFTCFCRVTRVMVGTTRSEKSKAQEQERKVEEDMVGKTNSQPPLLLFSCQDLFAKIAEATGESLESVCQMQEAERNGLVEVLKLQQVGFDNSLP